MRHYGLLKNFIGICFLILAGCGEPPPNAGSGTIALVQTGGQVADSDLLIQVAKEFYTTHPDQYDMLVVWSARELAPGHSFYFPVKNDVPGIGYGNMGEEFFDASADFGSTQLQGIIWMGPDWITNTDHGEGPRSVLGILAQETGHRWAATIHFQDPASGTDSSALLEDAYHWNFYLTTGASPMGGNKWESLGNSLYRALPVEYVEYCPLDLYLMSLITAREVTPLQLLVNIHSPGDLSAPPSSKIVSRTTEPVTVHASVMEIPIDAIIAAEGTRDPAVGFTAKKIRQAWIYVYQDPFELLHPGLDTLRQLNSQWDDYFSRATGGRSSMSTTLR